MTSFLLGLALGCGGTAAVAAVWYWRRSDATGGDSAAPFPPPAALLDDAEPRYGDTAAPNGAIPPAAAAAVKEGTQAGVEAPAEQLPDDAIGSGAPPSLYRELLADWYWSMPYVRKLLGLITEKT